MSWHRPHVTARPTGDTLLCSRQVTAFMLRVHPDTVKRRYQPSACDIATRVPLFDPVDPLPNRPGVLLA